MDRGCAGRAADRRGRVIMVAAQTTRSLLHLAVAVQRDGRGFLVVSRYPSIVGQPVSDRYSECEPRTRSVRVRCARSLGGP